jgi:hypothetical protein
MSVVSSKLGAVSVSLKKRRVVGAVQYNPGPNPFDIFSQGAVAPTFGGNRYRKPNLDSDVKQYPMGVVPLRCDQAGYIEPEGAVYKTQKVAGPMPVPTRMRMENTTDEVNPAFPNYDYLAPIRPGPRKLNPFLVSEPAGAMYRP